MILMLFRSLSVRRFKGDFRDIAHTTKFKSIKTQFQKKLRSLYDNEYKRSI